MSKKSARVAPTPNDPDPFSMPGSKSWKSVLAELRLGQNVAHWRSKASSNSSYRILLSQAGKIPGMSKLGQDALHAIAKEMDDLPCENGDTIIRQGDLVSNTFYLVAYGTFEAVVDDTVVKTYKGESFFGDLALLRNEPRAATVRCVEDGLLWALDRATFRTNIIGVTLREAADQIGFLAKMDPATLDAMVDDMFEVKCIPGQTVITEGDPGDNFFLVEDGKFEAWLADRGRDKPVKIYEAGSGFGELALLQNIPRAASVQCVEAGRLWAIDRLAFRKQTLGYMVAQASTSRNVFAEEEDEEADHLGAAEADEEAAPTTEEETDNLPPAGTVETTAPAPGEEAAVPPTAADGKRVVAINFESDKEKRARKSLRMSPKLNDLLGLLWDAADIHLTRMYRASYLNYHLSLTRFILTSQDEEQEFDAIDAFEAALMDWERDTDQGSLPAVHRQALLDSVFEVVDLYTNTLKEKEYLTFAKGLVRQCTIKVKGEPKRTFRHEWVFSKDRHFLARALTSLQAQLPSEVAPAQAPKTDQKQGSKRTLGTFFRLPSLFGHVLDVVEKSLSSGVRRLGELSGLSPKAKLVRHKSSVRNSMRKLTPAAQREARHAALGDLFERWATPMFDAEELRLRKLGYIGNRRHADDTKAVRLGALSQLLSDAGASLNRGDQGLPQLLGVYHMLDMDDDGWITEADFKSALLELSVDPTDVEKGPLHNGEPIDLLGASRSGLAAAKHEDVPDAALMAKAGDATKAERRTRRANLKGSEVKRSQADGHLAELKAEAAQSKLDAATGKTAKKA